MSRDAGMCLWLPQRLSVWAGLPCHLLAPLCSHLQGNQVFGLDQVGVEQECNHSTQQSMSDFKLHTNSSDLTL